MILELRQGLFINFDKVLTIEEVNEDRLRPDGNVSSRFYRFANPRETVNFASMYTEVAWASNNRTEPFIVVTFEDGTILFLHLEDRDILRAFLDQHRR